MTDMISTSPLLQVDNFSLHYRAASGPIPILRDINISLGRGEVVGIIGESGAGKSTLGNAILGLLAPEFEQSGGVVSIAGQALEDLEERQREAIRRRRISAIFQDHTMSLDPLMTIGAQISETIRASNAGLTRREIHQRVVELLDRVGIEEPKRRLDSYPHQFSGGQRQRIVIAMALAGSPDIVIADEPTSALDATVQKQILELLRVLVDETGISIVLVTHDMGVIAQIADRVVVMRSGQIAEQGEVSTILNSPRNDYTRRLLAAVPQLRVSEPAGRDAAETTVSICSPQKGVADLSAPRPALAAQSVFKTFSNGGLFSPAGNRAGKFTLHDISIDLAPGTITGVVGESGSGKSTIGRIIAGLETAGAGTISIGGDAFDASSPGSRSGLLGRVQMIFQDPAVSLSPRMTINQALLESTHFGAGETSADGARSIQAMMDRVGLPQNLLPRYPHQLSGGQKQRVAIARALLARPQIIVADEPTSALDVSVQAEIILLLKSIIEEQGVTVMFISHDLAVVQDLCAFVYVFKEGRVEDFGLSDFIFMQSQNPYTRSLIEARPRRFLH